LASTEERRSIPAQGNDLYANGEKKTRNKLMHSSGGGGERREMKRYVPVDGDIISQLFETSRSGQKKSIEEVALKKRREKEKGGKKRSDLGNQLYHIKKHTEPLTESSVAKKKNAKKNTLSL